jgi:hypothetical protein
VRLGDKGGGYYVLGSTGMGATLMTVMLGLFRFIDESTSIVEESSPPDDVVAYATVAGAAAGPILIDIWKPLFVTHPELKPCNWI